MAKYIKKLKVGEDWHFMGQPTRVPFDLFWEAFYQISHVLLALWYAGSLELEMGTALWTTRLIPTPEPKQGDTLNLTILILKLDD